MVTLDLERGVSEERCQKFCTKLADLNWNKIPKVTTTWKCSWANDQANNAITHVVQSDLKSAAAGNPTYLRSAGCRNRQELIGNLTSMKPTITLQRILLDLNSPSLSASKLTAY